MTNLYRPDIDGMRALAVASIVFFHVGLDGFDGGYVGVDIFFVISGYLITSIILREIRAGEFSLRRFYERRIRRILPALFVTLLATVAVGSVLLNPSQFAELGSSAAATSLFSSNIFFFLGAGYFDGPSEHKPLLHTWSLAVEEQFYLLFPLLMLAIARRLGGRFALWLAAIAGLSLVAAIAGTGIDEDAAFFLLPFRAWELLFGGFLALGVMPVPRSALLRNVLAATGLMCMLAAVHWLDTDTPFPGTAALLPTLGAALVIHAGCGGPSFVSRALSLRPLVFVGLISYSLYLIHWPLIVYGKRLLINAPNGLEIAVMLTVSFVLAVLSWRYVERPFRDHRRVPRRRLFSAAAVATLVVGASGVAIAALAGLPGRGDADPLANVVVDDPGWRHWKQCEEMGEEDLARLCSLGDPAVEPSFLLWGDSHALAMASALNLAAKRNGVSGLLAVRTGCPPLMNIERRGRSSCADFNQEILSRVLADERLGVVILAARWAISATGRRYKREEGADITLVDLQAELGADADNGALFATGLRRTVRALGGKRVSLVAQIPEVGFDVPSANYVARLTGRDVNATIAPTVAEYRARTASVADTFASLATQVDLTIIDPAPTFCDADRCRVAVDGRPLYRDDHHLSLLGCVRIAPLFDAVIASSASD